VTQHALYKALGKTKRTRQENYQALFATEIEEQTLTAIRESTNKAWVLGSDSFKEKIADKVNRPITPAAKGGDRKSKGYKKYNYINRV
ncbi:MAG: transposase, partial [Endozoicomonadaceae bacterium]|nr:transposase [Endozoicomonadaceae bacterium]